MFWRSRLAFGAFLITGSVFGVIAVAITTMRVPESAPLRGAVFGLAGGLFGASLFTAGVLYGRSEILQAPRGGIPPRVRKPAVSPAEAKFWLQRFLEEHQGHGDRKSVE
jgi:hypothetical protein